MLYFFSRNLNFLLIFNILSGVECGMKISVVSSSGNLEARFMFNLGCANIPLLRKI